MKTIVLFLLMLTCTLKSSRGEIIDGIQKTYRVTQVNNNNGAGSSSAVSYNVALLDFVKDNMTWTAPQNYCRNRAADLVTVYKEEDIGQLLNNSKIQEFWIGLHCDSSNWHWSDGEKLTYSNWDRDLFCAFAQSNGSWSDSVCNENKTFICYNKTGNIMEAYFWINTSMNWSRAQNYCRVNYTDLVSIRNETENEAMRKNAQGDNFWIGLFNNPWKWSDGGNSTFRNWNIGNPDNCNHIEKCVVNTFQRNVPTCNENGNNCGKNNSQAKGWNDANCNNMKTFFCTNRTNVSTSYYFVSTPMSWDDAQKYCRANNTDLVTVENETVNSELLNISDNRSWIGLRHETNHWYWSNGDPVAYTNWIHNFSCAVFQADGSWNDSDCNQQKPFMCYKDVMNVTFVNKNVTWEEALDYCIKVGSSLISITSQTEQEALAALLHTTNSSTIWLGLRQSRLFGFWFWVDERPLSYENWANGNHLNLSNSHHCAATSKTNFTWIDVSCSDSHSFICKSPLNIN
ncbi:macrophage mannose receptor 1-like isoform X3 [Erpetoichthys calabaricus]|uniref:macrophage mannose receptor 1-like isoform X3 n=1 Tax=Erpetoichthys calabaricus TaxID=27687 RepID=UPI0022343F6A|nr:macrophage mannose receptor 1-like isoform X3 [Erpetoichthys calabaricus]